MKKLGKKDLLGRIKVMRDLRNFKIINRNFSDIIYNILIREVDDTLKDAFTKRVCIYGYNEIFENFLDKYSVSDIEYIRHEFNSRSLNSKRGIDKWRKEYSSEIKISWWNSGIDTPQMFKYELTSENNYIILYIVSMDDMSIDELLSKVNKCYEDE